MRALRMYSSRHRILPRSPLTFELSQSARMSPPAQRPRSPAPSSRITATAGSASNASSALSMSRNISSVTALIAFGRFRRRMPAEPSRRAIRSPSATVTCRHRAPSISLARHDQPHDFVGPFQDLVHAQIAHDLLDAVFAEVAVAAMQLQRLVGDLEADVGAKTLGHRAQHGGVRILAVERCGGTPDKSPRRLQFGRHVGEAELQRLEFVEALAEGFSLLHVGQRLFQRALRAAERTGRDIDAAAVEPGHRDLEADALVAQAGSRPARARSRKSPRGSAARSSPSCVRWRRTTARACRPRSPASRCRRDRQRQSAPSRHRGRRRRRRK